MQLADQLREARTHKDILLMTHLVLGYPSFAVNREVIRQMVANGVDMIELQIPFSEPMADGPMIIKANQEAIANGTKVADCLAFAEEMAAKYKIPFLFMTYYNIPFKYGLRDFLHKAREIGIRGCIIPDLPPEEGEEYLGLAKEFALAPIQIFAPTSTEERMRTLAGHGDGFIYCVARRGVTGSKTEFDASFDAYLSRCRKATDLPLAVGFGISSREDVQILTGKADLAVIGTATIRLVEEKGPEAVGPFIAGLIRHPHKS
ncbi:MAG: tryptophan synthase subunit alpha [Deltaproteobacteria bacterium RIFOXYD12_FULL_55_16]|nr:MAG: tryptophan synthase subunit alpha [Deltaproteobacteria bacterium RIFOXYD12_FULL_55_16]